MAGAPTSGCSPAQWQYKQRHMQHTPWCQGRHLLGERRGGPIRYPLLTYSTNIIIKHSRGNEERMTIVTTKEKRCTRASVVAVHAQRNEHEHEHEQERRFALQQARDTYHSLPGLPVGHSCIWHCASRKNLPKQDSCSLRWTHSEWPMAPKDVHCNRSNPNNKKYTVDGPKAQISAASVYCMSVRTSGAVHLIGITFAVVLTACSAGSNDKSRATQMLISWLNMQHVLDTAVPYTQLARATRSQVSLAHSAAAYTSAHQCTSLHLLR